MSDRNRRPHFDLLASRAAVESLARLSSGEETELPELAAAAQQLPDFRALILRAANASTHGLQHPISSPKHAMAMLGTSKIKELVNVLIEQDQSLRSATSRLIPRPQESDAE